MDPSLLSFDVSNIPPIEFDCDESITPPIEDELLTEDSSWSREWDRFISERPEIALVATPAIPLNWINDEESDLLVSVGTTEEEIDVLRRRMIENSAGLVSEEDKESSGIGLQIDANVQQAMDFMKLPLAQTLWLYQQKMFLSKLGITEEQFNKARRLLKIEFTKTGEGVDFDVDDEVALSEHGGMLMDAHTFAKFLYKLLGQGETEANPKQFGALPGNNVFTSEFDQNFEPSRMLGSGTFGCVFLARHKKEECYYAVKRIPFQTRNGEEENALKEVKALSHLMHSGIVRYNHAWIEKPPNDWQAEYDEEMLQQMSYLREINNAHQINYKRDSAFLYVQMEHCPFTLESWLSHNYHRDLNRMKSWFVQIVSGVSYIHQMGKIHRDLKPSNILFSKEDQLKICDLGIVTDIVTTKYEGGQIVEDLERTDGQGTPMYMAPEQMGWFAQYSNKVDIFSLGLIFAELCVPMYEKEDVSHQKDNLTKISDGSEQETYHEVMFAPLNMDPEMMGWEKDSDTFKMFSQRLLFTQLFENQPPINRDMSWKSQVFNSYREGKPNMNLGDRLTKIGAAEFVDWLTCVDDSKRPECKEILHHPFLKDSVVNTEAAVDTLKFIDSAIFPSTAKAANQLLDYPQIQRRLREVFEEDYDSEFLSKFEPEGIVGSGDSVIAFKARNILDKSLYTVIRISTSESDCSRQFEDVLKAARDSEDGFNSYKRCWIEKPPPRWQHLCDGILLPLVGGEKLIQEHSEDCVFIYCQTQICGYSLAEWLRDSDIRDLALAKTWFRQIVSEVSLMLQGQDDIDRHLEPDDILIDKNYRLQISNRGNKTERLMSLIGKSYLHERQSTEIGKDTYNAPEMCLPDDFEDGPSDISVPDDLDVHEGFKINMPSKSIMRRLALLWFSTSKSDIFSLGLIFVDLCVVMTIEERRTVFDNYRKGRINSFLDHLPEVKDFVEWILKVEPTERPTCEEILAHSFL